MAEDDTMPASLTTPPPAGGAGESPRQRGRRRGDEGATDGPAPAATRVSLYEEARGRLTIHLNGQPLAYRLQDPSGRDFAADAAALAAASVPDWWGTATCDVLDLSMLPELEWPDRTGRLVAWWEDSNVTGLLLHVRAGVAEAVEATGRARRYIGPPGIGL